MNDEDIKIVTNGIINYLTPLSEFVILLAIIACVLIAISTICRFSLLQSEFARRDYSKFRS